MVAVNVVDGVKYGFRLLGYLLAVSIGGLILIAIGAAFAPGPLDSGNPILAFIFILAGAAVIYAGGLGLLYKVIADGVEIGTLSAEHGGGAGTQAGGTGYGGQGGGQQYAQGTDQQYRRGGQTQGNPQGGQRGAEGAPTTEDADQPPADWEPGN